MASKGVGFKSPDRSSGKNLDDSWFYSLFKVPCPHAAVSARKIEQSGTKQFAA
jgi:hypothetical protein